MPTGIKFFFSLIIIGLFIPQSKAQNDTLISPFAKGKFMTGLSGNISSGGVREIGTGFASSVFENKYAINTQSGVFVKDRWSLGLSFTISRINNSDVFNLSSEILALGPFTRYYLSDYHKGSVFIELTLFYANLFEESKLDDPNLNIHSILRGKGIGIKPAFGFTYAFTKTVGFDMGLELSLSVLNATLSDLINETEEKESIFSENVAFRFGFIILINEFFF